MKRILALLLFALATATISFAQSNFQDVIYLKDGSVVRGTIIDQVPNKSVQIKMADKTVFIYQMDQIEKLTREPNQFKDDGSHSGSGFKGGYTGGVEMGYQIGLGEDGLNRLMISVINGYQVNPYFSIGVGTGLRYYFQNVAALIPFFGEFKVNFKNDGVSPFLSLGAGYSFDATNGFSPAGFLLAPKFGIILKAPDKWSAISFGLGYELQMARYNIGGYGSGSGNMGAVSISVGLLF